MELVYPGGNEESWEGGEGFAPVLDTLGFSIVSLGKSSVYFNGGA